MCFIPIRLLLALGVALIAAGVANAGPLRLAHPPLAVAGQPYINGHLFQAGGPKKKYSARDVKISQVPRRGGSRKSRAESEQLSYSLKDLCVRRGKVRRYCRDRYSYRGHAALTDALILPPNAATKPVLDDIGLPAIEGVPGIAILQPDGRPVRKRDNDTDFVFGTLVR